LKVGRVLVVFEVDGKSQNPLCISPPFNSAERRDAKEKGPKKRGSKEKK
jgi:hypothetical protein